MNPAKNRKPTEPKGGQCKGFDDPRAFVFRLRDKRTGEVVRTRYAALNEAVRHLQWDPKLTDWQQQGHCPDGDIEVKQITPPKSHRPNMPKDYHKKKGGR